MRVFHCALFCLFVSFCCYCFLWDKVSPCSPGWPWTCNSPPGSAPKHVPPFLFCCPVKLTAMVTLGGESFVQDSVRAGPISQDTLLSSPQDIPPSCSTEPREASLLHCSSPSCSVAPEETGSATLCGFPSLLPVPSQLINLQSMLQGMCQSSPAGSLSRLRLNQH